MAAPAAPLTHGERLVAEFTGKQALLVTLVAEPALRAQVVLSSLGGTKKDHYRVAAMYSLPMLRVVTVQYGPPADAWIMYWAAWAGNLACLRYLHAAGCPWGTNTAHAAAREGHLECLRYLHENGCPWDEWVAAVAAREGHLPCLQYIHEVGRPWGENTTFCAAQSGHLDCLQYAVTQGCEWHLDATSNAASSCRSYCQHHDESERRRQS
jgi:hypothetical protein